MLKHVDVLVYADTIATLRLIATLGMEQGQRKLIRKLQQNLIETLRRALGDSIRNIEIVKDIMKIPDA